MKHIKKILIINFLLLYLFNYNNLYAQHNEITIINYYEQKLKFNKITEKEKLKLLNLYLKNNIKYSKIDILIQKIKSNQFKKIAKLKLSELNKLLTLYDKNNNSYVMFKLEKYLYTKSVPANLYKLCFKHYMINNKYRYTASFYKNNKDKQDITNKLISDYIIKNSDKLLRINDKLIDYISYSYMKSNLDLLYFASLLKYHSKQYLTSLKFVNYYLNKSKNTHKIPNMLKLKSKIHIHLKEPLKALKILKDYETKINNSDTEIMILLTQIYETQNNYKERNRYYIKLLNYNITNKFKITILTKLINYYKSSDEKITLYYARKLYELEPNNILANSIIINKGKNIDRIYKNAEKILEKEPNNYKANLILALKLLNEKKYKKSLVYLLKLYNINQKNESVKEKISECYYFMAKDYWKKKDIKLSKKIVMLSLIYNKNNNNSLKLLLKILDNIKQLDKQYFLTLKKIILLNKEPYYLWKYFRYLYIKKRFKNIYTYFKGKIVDFKNDFNLNYYYLDVLLRLNKKKEAYYIVNSIYSKYYKGFNKKEKILFLKLFDKITKHKNYILKKEIYLNFLNLLPDKNKQKYLKQLLKITLKKNELKLFKKINNNYKNLIISYKNNELTGLYIKNIFKYDIENKNKVILFILEQTKFDSIKNKIIEFWYKNKNYKLIVEKFNKKIPDEFNSKLYLAISLYHTNKKKKSLKMLRDLYLLNSNDLLLNYYLAINYLDDKFYSKALFHFKICYASNPEYKDVVYFLSKIEWEKNKTNQTLLKIKAKYLKNKKNEKLKQYYITILNEWGNKLLNSGDSVTALINFLYAYKLDYNNSVSLKNLGDYYFSYKNYNKALKYYGKYLIKHSDDIKVLFKLSVIYNETQDYKKYKNVLLEILTIDPDNIIAKTQLINSGYEDLLNESDTMIKMINRHLKNFDINIKLQKNNEINNKIKQLKILLEYRPHYYKIYIALYNLYLQKKDYNSAKKMLEKYLEKIKDKDVLYDLSVLYLNTDDLKKSYEIMKELYNENPDDLKITIGYFRILMNNLMYDKAIKLIEMKKSDFYKGNKIFFADIYYKLSIYKLQKKDYQKAIQYITISNVLNYDISKIILKSKLLYKLDQTRKSIKLLEDVSTSDIFYLKQIYELLGYFYAEISEYNKSKLMYKNIILMKNKDVVNKINYKLLNNKDILDTEILQLNKVNQMNLKVYLDYKQEKYNSILENYPDEKNYIFYKIMACIKMREYNLGLKIISKNINLIRTNSSNELIYNVCIIYNKNEMYNKSLNLLKLIKRKDNSTLFLKSYIYYKLKKYNTAYKICKNIRTNDIEILKLKSNILYKLKKYKQNIKLIRKIIKKHKNESLLFDLGLNYYKLKQNKKSLDVCKKLVKNDFPYKTRLFNLIANNYFDLKKYRLSIIYIDKSLKINSNQKQLLALRSIAESLN